MPIPYYSDTDCKVIRLDYSKNGLSALLVLPKEQIDDFIESLTYNALKTYVSSFVKAKVYVEVPVFNMTSDQKLAESLKLKGVNDAFGSKSEFSNLFIDEKDQSYIDDIVQKGIAVNEEWTEAASVTIVKDKSEGKNVIILLFRISLFCL